MSRIQEDQRIDPRIKQVFGAFLEAQNPGDVTSREQAIERANSEDAATSRREWKAFVDQCDTEEIAPSAGLAISTREVAAEPDGNIINIQFIRPGGEDAKPCVYYYIHGLGVQSGSCYGGNNAAWGRIIAEGWR